jgi:hypothetical protein
MQQQINIKLDEHEMRVIDRLRKREKPKTTRTTFAKKLLRDALALASGVRRADG